MLVMRVAATALSHACSYHGLRAVTRLAGFTGDAAPLDGLTASALGIAGYTRGDVVAGPGAVRLLVLELSAPGVLRDAAQRLARHLASRAPHVLWVLAMVDRAGRHALIAALTADGGPRLASFAWEPERVTDSDAETLCALAAVASGEESLYHERCSEVLGREALTRRFYRALESRVNEMAASLRPGVVTSDARTVALLYASRLLFLRFLEAKGWLDGDRDFLAARFDACMQAGGEFHRRTLLPLFFGTLNTPRRARAERAKAFGRIPFLNGGLFARTPVERRLGRCRFPDEAIGALFSAVFHRFRFVVREDTASWSEASVDPEMLGRAFESLMVGEERRRSGVYYTPHALVDRLTAHALDRVVETASLAAVRRVRVLDPACGSGAFLVHVLERLADLRRQRGDEAPVAVLRRDVLARNIFGVDLNPTAVWLCELRLWLSVVIESDEADPLRVPPLPNLDRNIRVGDALAGPAFTDSGVILIGGTSLERLRGRYTRATGVRKASMARQLDREERRRMARLLEHHIESVQQARRDLLAAVRSRDLFGDRAPPSAGARRTLAQWRDELRAARAELRRVNDGGALPFSFPACFADAHADGGFDVVVGNPPWVRLHRIPESLRRQFRYRFRVFASAAWQAGATGARASAGFASQVDLSALFVERSLTLLRDGGTMALLVPAKLWRSLSGGGVRQYLRDRARLLRLEDLSRGERSFDAAVYPSIVVARTGEPTTLLNVAVQHGVALREWQTTGSALAFDDSPGAPWLTLPPDARAAFHRLRKAGTPLHASVFGAPRLGVKSGCNAAFMVCVLDSARGLASVEDADGERGTVEEHLLRPALRGDSVVAWRRRPSDECIVWTHDGTGAPLARLPARTRLWLGRHYSALTLRTDAAGSRRWWSLFRVDAADPRRPRVVWADIGRRPRACVLPAGDPAVPMNSCYVLSCPDDLDAWALAALLNSPVAAAWLNALAEPARGGYRRYFGWTVGLLPLPRDWPRAREVLAESCQRDDDILLDAALRAYGITHGDMAALLAHE